MFKKIGYKLREFEQQGYPITSVYISPKYMSELQPFLLEAKDEEDKPIVKLPINGKEYLVKKPAPLAFGDVYMTNGGTDEEGIYAIFSDGSEVSLLDDMQNSFDFNSFNTTF